jgi:hypothetical protein
MEKTLNVKLEGKPRRKEIVETGERRKANNIRDIV